MTSDSQQIDIRNNKDESQFETIIDGAVALAAYELEPGDRIVFTHTIVPDQLSGRGIAQSLAKHALDDARARKLTVVPQCAFIAAYIKRHPEYEDLLQK
jgi:predicted GNAT family acetyltransferase